MHLVLAEPAHSLFGRVRVLVLLAVVVVVSPFGASAQTHFDILHFFTRNGIHPAGRLLEGADGNIYGTTSEGGASDWGTVFRMTPDGTLSTLHSFGGGAAGAVPQAALIQGTDGNFYGTTSGYSGSLGLSGCGTVFRMTPAGSVVTLHAFTGVPDGCRSMAPLIEATDGNFYGTTGGGGAHARGAIFRLTRAGALTVLYSFGGGADGAGPASLVQATDGHLYGTTGGDGAFKAGTVYRITLSGVLTPLYAFQGANERSPSSLIQASDGMLYGTTHGEVGYDWTDPGTAFRLTLDGAFTRLHSFLGPEGYQPVGGLLQASDGLLYGVSVPGDSYTSEPLVFRMTAEGSVTKVYSFGPAGWRAAPDDGLIEAADGTLYGVSGYDGPDWDGVLFQMAKNGSSYATRYQFSSGPGGQEPVGGLLRAGNGDFYGTTEWGGTGSRGTIFRMTPEGTVTSLYSEFTNPTLGGPRTGLIEGGDGKLYGTTTSTLFSIGPDGGYAVVRVLDPPHTRSSYPSTVIRGADGNFYGTTTNDIGSTSAPTCGSIFRVTPAGTLSVLHHFTSLYGGPDGCFGGMSLIQARDGLFYGMTMRGGLQDLGTIFRTSPAGGVTILHSFAGGPADGSDPRGALVEGTDGYLYGVTPAGGAFGHGVAFRISPAGTFAVLHSFKYTDNGVPWAGLVEGPDRNFYGMTRRGAFAMTPAGQVTLVYLFSDDSYGFPDSLTSTGGGDFYGTAEGGPAHQGVVFRLSVRGTLSGRVRRTITGAPIAHARVTTEPGGFVTETDAAGAYTLVVPIGMYTVTITAGGHRPNATAGVLVGPNAALSQDATLVPFTLGDFDDDARADRTLYRPSTSAWVIRSSAEGSAEHTLMWGAEGDVPLVADFDGDGASDIAVFRAATGHWFILSSSTHFAAQVTEQWGSPGDLPVPADYDGDRRADLAVYRPSTGMWYFRRSSDHAGFGYRWGDDADVPVPGDYDGDGRTDIAVFRAATGHWFVLQSSRQFTTHRTFQWGTVGDVPVASDYDGDGGTDLAIYRPSSGGWYILKSGSSFSAGDGYVWGADADVPVPADYDGDGRTDIAVYRRATGHWFILESSARFTRFRTYESPAAPDAVPVLKQP